MSAQPQKIKTCLWFDGQAEEAAELYTSLFDDSRVTQVQRYSEVGPGEPGSVMVVMFELAGTEFMGLNGGPEFQFTEAASVYVDCDDQKEVDRLWSALTADGGQEGPCGWLKDKYGLSWQIIPRVLDELITDPDPARSGRAMKAMLSMGKLDVQALVDAADGK
ncbi:VOC family protein [Streptomyces sp. LHD-70]|uniref:VOC family protein n=1 Tax=Streptomyces sp. LHD-70 TaxID=3072140 RepID=UPI00280DB439|nr:VOC family protein [Streptomyces sp. LHD-70]MDQ8705755.1 VOC family protein [Streptomyces sp. LHD-70]